MMGIKSLLFLTMVSIAHGEPGDCTFYDRDTDNCHNGCGSCFNPGGRAGVMCNAEATGYYCPSDNPSPDMAYACMDWTFGSKAMQAAENSFNARRSSDSPVYFGIGTYGTGNDPQRGLGACYLLEVSGVDRNILVQSINTGSDVSGDQFDLQIGDGGCGAYNTCAGGAPDESMFPGDYEPWGNIYGGADHRSQCAGLPPYPNIPGPMQEAGDNLIELCEYSFDKHVRGEGGANPDLQAVSRVACPPELVEFTQIQRTDDPSEGESIVIVPKDEEHTCQLPGSGAYCLTRMMDCRKPSGAFKDNVVPTVVMEGMKLVQPCTGDGYTRIDVQCGCYDCYC